MARSCNRTYLPLCSIPARASKDGLAGANAKIFLPFSDAGLYFFSGASYSDPTARVEQDPRRFIGGVTMPNVFHKDCCS